MPKRRRVLITGGTSGLGHAIAKAFWAHGDDVALVALESKQEASQALEDIRRVPTNAPELSPPQLTYHQADLCRDSACRGLLEALEREQENGDGRLVDILINNAGVQHVAPVEDFAIEQWQRLLTIHLTAPFLLIQGVLPFMRCQGWGRIINVASAHGQVASAGKSAYVSAKHGLLGLTKVVALETANQNITCNAICPGWIATPLVHNQIEAIARRESITVDQAKQNLLAAKHPAVEFVNTAALTDLCLLLGSEAGRSFRGAALNIDCGWIAQ